MQIRPNGQRYVGRLQLGQDKLTFRHVFQRQLQIKFLRDPDRRADIISPVSMRFERQLFAYDRQHRVQLHVESRAFARILTGFAELH